MKENDYFVIAYKILAYLYDCLKEGTTVDVRKIDEKALNINLRYWSWIMKALQGAGRIKGVIEIPRHYDVKIRQLEITEEGIIFLQENSGIERAKSFMMDIKAIIPGV